MRGARQPYTTRTKGLDQINRLRLSRATIARARCRALCAYILNCACILNYVCVLPILIAVLLSLSTISFAYAQDIDTDAARQAGQIERVQQGEVRLREEQALRKATAAPDGTNTPDETRATLPEMASSRPDETCIKIDRILVHGASLVGVKELQRTVAQFEGQCLGLAALNNVLEALTHLYVEHGFIASRAYLPAQDLSSGLLDVVVIEGSLEGIALEHFPKSGNRFSDKKCDKNKKTSAFYCASSEVKIALEGQLSSVGSKLSSDSSGHRIATAFAGMVGRPVNLRDIEQGLDQINRLRSVKATIALGNGASQGGSVLDVTIEQIRPWHASLSVDNLGGVATGIYQSRIDVGYDNLFGVNDEWQFGYQRSMDRQPLFFSDERPNSNTLAGSVSIPYGYWTFGVNGSWSDYHSTLAGPLSIIETSGGSKSVSPYVMRILHRDQISKTWATGRLTWKETENFLLGSRLDVASRALSIASFELGHSRQLFGGQASAGIGYHKGLGIFGAFDDRHAPDGSPSGQFDKLTASIGYFRAQDIGGSTLIFNTSLSGQWTNDALFGSEQMSLGGYSSVRGVREAVLYADKAVFMRNELSFLLPQVNDGATVQAIGRLEPYLALDWGHAVAGSRGNSLGGTLVGGAVGIRNRGGKMIFDLSWADIISMPDLPDNVEISSGLVQARVTVSF